MGEFRVIAEEKGRIDLRAKATGRAHYADDLSLPGMLFARLKRGGTPHARIVSIDCSRALALPGVHAVLTGEDFPVRYGILPVHQDETALAVDKVRYAGEPVAAVCAETEQIADEACALIDVRYEPLPLVLDYETAVRGTTRVHDSPKFEGNAHRVVSLEFGDVEAALAASSHRREDVFYYGGNTHAPMETHATLADFDGNRLTLTVSHQAPYYLQKILPKVLGLPAHALRVVVPYVGGGFGGKLDPFPDTICAGKFSMLTGRPVKLTLSREEVFYNHRGRHASLMWIRSGWDGDRLRALHFRALLDGGAYGSFGTAATFYHGALQGTTYRIPTYKAEMARFYTNKPPCGPKRGHGTPQPRFALECHLDKVAEALGVSPHALRSANLMRPNSITVNHLRIGTCGLQKCLDQVVQASQFESLRGRLPRGEGIGLAVGCYISGAALPIWWNDMPHAEVILKADRSGTITAYSGHTEIGQGADMILCQIVAEVLGLKASQVALVLRDSDCVPPDLGSYSSRVTLMMGNAAKEAAEKLRAVLAEAAADELGDSVESLRFADRRVHGSKERSLSLEEAIELAEARHGLLSFNGSYTPRPEYGDFKGAGVGPSPAYSYAACVVRLGVDESTGFVRPSKIWISHDIGRALNRTSVEGQVIGGVYMALGELMMEEMEFTREGLLRNVGLLDYKTPTMLEMPDVEVHLVEEPDAAGPFGAKEVGQGPLLPVLPAFANAVHDAIGIRFDEIPITPQKVLRALRRDADRVGPRRMVDFAFPAPIRVEVPADAASESV